MVREVARAIRIPFAVGGGISTARRTCRACCWPARRRSRSTRWPCSSPQIIAEGARAFGSPVHRAGHGPGARRTIPRGSRAATRSPSRGFRERTGLDALEWARRAEDLGAGEIVVNSVDADGTRAGLRAGADAADRRGACACRWWPRAARASPRTWWRCSGEAHADAAIIAGMIHTGEYTIPRSRRSWRTRAFRSGGSGRSGASPCAGDAHEHEE